MSMQEILYIYCLSKDNGIFLKATDFHLKVPLKTFDISQLVLLRGERAESVDDSIGKSKNLYVIHIYGNIQFSL